MSTPCRSTRCLKCQLLHSDTHIQVNNSPLTVTDNLNCNSENVIYVIKCMRCDMCYIGETKNPVRSRINQHLSSIYRELDLPVAQHFNSTPHVIHDDFRFTPVCRETNPKSRKQKESRLIIKFGTEHPLGLNERSDNITRGSSILPLVVPYCQGNANFGSKVIDLSNKHEVTENRVIIAFTKHRNIKSILF